MRIMKNGMIKLVLLQIILFLLDWTKIKLQGINLKKGELELTLLFKKKSKNMLILYLMLLQKKVKLKKSTTKGLRWQ
jgi:hypothetical protein